MYSWIQPFMNLCQFIVATGGAAAATGVFICFFKYG